MSAGASIELFFVNGNPDGMVTAEMFNWTGHVLRTPRTLLKSALERERTMATGVYILLDDLALPTKAYVGESEDVSKRIRTHDTAKDWSTVAVVCTTDANSLNKAHAQYIEARLVQIANEANPNLLENAQNPKVPGLNEAARSNMEKFIDNLMVVLPSIKVDLFDDKARPQTEGSPVEKPDAQPEFQLVMKKDGLEARAVLNDGEFIVQPGSRVRGSWVGKGNSYKSLREKLVSKGVIVVEGGHHVFAQSYAFASPSAASAVIVGRSDNGRLSWKHVVSGTSYADWENRKLEEVVG